MPGYDFSKHVAPTFSAEEAAAEERLANEILGVAVWKTTRGPYTQVEILQADNVLEYRLSGQGIASQVGTSHQTVTELLEVLLAPLGLRESDDGTIVEVI